MFTSTELFVKNCWNLTQSHSLLNIVKVSDSSILESLHSMAAFLIHQITLFYTEYIITQDWTGNSPLLLQ